MRYFITAIALILFPGCASTTEQLFSEANLSGNWAAYNHRLQEEEESAMARQDCRTGEVLFCKFSGDDDLCTCMPTIRLQEQIRWSRGQNHRNRN
jgi:hypothetical protein